MQRLKEILGDVRWLGTTFAAFAAMFGVLTVSDLDTFYTGYFAGAGGAIALTMWLEED